MGQMTDAYIVEGRQLVTYLISVLCLICAAFMGGMWIGSNDTRAFLIYEKRTNEKCRETGGTAIKYLADASVFCMHAPGESSGH
jgi:hypothetical protein